MKNRRKIERKRLSKAMKGAPTWLKTVQIGSGVRGRPLKGTFGPASPVTTIRPEALKIDD